MLTPLEVFDVDAVQSVLYVNPIVLGPEWLARQATLWNKHKVRAMTLHYMPIVPATESGSLFFSYNQDIEDSTPFGDGAFTRLMTYAGAQAFSVSRPFTWRVPVQSIKDDLYISSHEGTSDFRLVSQGQIYIGNAGGCSAKKYGNLMVSYDWELEGRQIEEDETISSPEQAGDVTNVPQQAYVVKDTVAAATTNSSIRARQKSTAYGGTVAGLNIKEIKGLLVEAKEALRFASEMQAAPAAVGAKPKAEYSLDVQLVPLLLGIDSAGNLIAIRAPCCCGLGYTVTQVAISWAGQSGYVLAYDRGYLTGLAETVQIHDLTLKKFYFTALGLAGPEAVGSISWYFGLLTMYHAAGDSVTVTVAPEGAHWVFEPNPDALPTLQLTGGEDDGVVVPTPAFVMPKLAHMLPATDRPPSVAAPCKTTRK